MKDSIEQFRKSAVCADVQGNKLAHSLLLVSRDEYALNEFGKNLAKALMCVNDDVPCNVCNECQKVEHNNNVDVQYYPKTNKVLNSEEISKLIENVYQSPYQSDKKVFILKNADKIDKMMQNKLLKTLEEPPRETYFALLASDENGLLPTIKSRCRIFYVPSITEREILEELEKLKVAPENIPTILRLARGNCSLAQKYAGMEDFKYLIELAQSTLCSFTKSWQMLEFSSKLYSISDKFLDFLEIVLQLCGNAAQILGGTGDSDDKIALGIAERFGINALHNFVSECGKFVEKKDRNCNYNSMVDSFLFMILEVCHKWKV